LGTTAYLIWGFAALYWVQIEAVPAWDIVAHRALWTVPVVFTGLALTGKLQITFRYLRQWRVLGVMAAAALFSACNWLIFMWAVIHGQATEASLGYFLLPLINVFVGLTLFRERIDRAERWAVVLAGIAVAIQFFHQGGVPVVALGVALSFGIYGAIRKAVVVGSMEGLFLETLIMVPFALTWLWFRDGAGLGQYGLRVDLFIMGAGLMTAAPLITYVAASRLLPLTALGLVFYIGPTVQLIVAVKVFGEALEVVQLVAFSLVWAGLALITLDKLRRSRKTRFSG
jgi:chloramphenicol-sensitive protein RarD